MDTQTWLKWNLLCYVCVCVSAQPCLTLCDPVDCSPPGKNTGVGSYSLLQRIFPTQESNLGLPHRRQIIYCWSPQGNPILYPNVPNFILIRKKKRPSWSENKGDIVGLRIPRVPTAKTGVKLAESSSPGSPAWSQEQKSWDPEWLPGSQNPLRCPPIPGHVWLPCPLPATDHGVCSPIHFNSLKLFLTSTATTLSSPWATLNLS